MNDRWPNGRALRRLYCLRGGRPLRRLTTADIARCRARARRRSA